MSGETPRSVGPYELERLLGRGGMGEVHRAYDRRLDRRVAVKHVRSGGGDGETRRARLRNEARAVAHLSHPAIVQILDILEEEDGDWIVMEFLDGPTLAELCKEGPLEVSQVMDYGRQIAEGLAEAHGKGIIHRDLKAENVMVARPGYVKILDFGIAKRLSLGEGDASLTEDGRVIGTCRAMSPEQARGLRLDARSDLFSFGTLLYEMLTGSSPFKGETELDTLSRVASEPHESIRDRRPDVPEDLAALVDELLQKAPEMRPQSAAEVVTRLGRIGLERAWEDFEEETLLPTLDESAEDRTLRDRPRTGAAPNAPVAGGAPDLSSAPPPSSSSTARRALGAPEADAGATRPSVEAWVESAPATYGAWRPPRRRGLEAAAVVAALLITAWLLSSWGRFWEPPAQSAEAPDPVSDLDPNLSTFELYRRGAELLQRFDRKGNVEEAITAFQRILAREPDSAPAHAGLARAYWRKYQNDSKDRAWLEQALPVAERAVDLDDHLAAARVSRGLVYAFLGRREEALTDLRQALILDPENAEAYLGLAEVHRTGGDLPAAEEALHSALAIRPDDRALHDELGSLYFRQARYDEAEAAFQQSIAVAPDGVFGYRNLAAVHISQGRYAEGATQLQKALEIQPDPSVYANLGSLLFFQGLYAQSVTAFEKALDLFAGSNDYRLWANVADAYRFTPDNEAKAADAYLRAVQLIGEKIELTPQDIGLRSRRALYLAKRGDIEAARRELEQVESLPGRDAQTSFRMVIAYEACGDREQALATLERALREGLPEEDVRREPELLDLRADPRYHRLMMRATGSASASGAQ